MSEQLREALSAVIDDEASQFELKRVLDEAGHDNDLRGRWERWHLVRDVLGGDHAPAALLPSDLPDKVWQVLHADPEAAVRPQADDADATDGDDTTGKRSVWGRVVGFGVAASVAFIVVIGSGLMDNAAVVPAGAVATVPQVGADPIAIDGPQVRLKSTVSASDVRRANAYMVHHVQQNAMNQAGMLNFVKVATFGDEDESVTRTDSGNVDQRSTGRQVSPVSGRSAENVRPIAGEVQ